MDNKGKIRISVSCNMNLFQHLYFNQIVLPKIWDVINEHIDALNDLGVSFEDLEESEEK